MAIGIGGLLAIQAVATLVTSLLRRRTKRIEPPKWDAPNIEEGVAIPYIFGRQIVTPTVAWWRGAPAETDDDDLPRYFAKAYYALSLGPVDYLFDVIMGEKSLALHSSTKASGDGTAGIAVVTPAFGDNLGDSDTFVISAYDLFGGKRGEGGVAGELRLYRGPIPQTVWRLDPLAIEAAEGTPGPAGMPGVCLAAFDAGAGVNVGTSGGFYWGMSPRAPDLKFILGRYPLQLNQATGNSDHRIGFDANPIHVIYELLIDDLIGMEVDADELDLDLFETAAAACYTEGLGVSGQVSRPEKVEDVIADLLRHAQGTPRYNRVTGKYGLVLQRADYDPETLPVLTEKASEGGIRNLEVEWLQYRGTINEVKVQYQRFVDGANAATEVTGETLRLLNASFGTAIFQTALPNISNVTIHHITDGWDQALEPGVWYAHGGEDKAVMLLDPVRGFIVFGTDADAWEGGDVIEVDYTAAPIAQSYREGVAVVQNVANLLQTRNVRTEVFDYRYYSHETNALRAASLLLRANSGQIKGVKWDMNRRGYALAPGDVVILNVPSKKVEGLIVRIVAVRDAEVDDRTITIEGAEDLYAIDFGPLALPPGGSTGGVPSLPTAPSMAISCISPGSIRLGLFPSDTSFSIEIERSTDSGGTGATIITPAGGIDGTETLYDDPQTPPDTFYYRARLIRAGWLDGPWTARIGCTATAGDEGDPVCVAPTYTITADAEAGSVTLTITDPQNRVSAVLFRTRSGTGAWSAWAVDSSAPYTATVVLSETADSEIQWRIVYLDCAGNEDAELTGAHVFPFDTDATPAGGIATATDLVRVVEMAYIPAVPEALTEPADGDGNLPLRFRKVIGDPARESRRVRIMARIAEGLAGSAGTTLALRASIGGGGFDYADGVSGPAVLIDAEGEAVSHDVLIAPEFFGDVVFQFVTLGGDGETPVGLIYADAEFITAGLDVELPNTDAPRCELDETAGESFETYADTSALLAAWPETDSAAYFTPTLSTDEAEDGTKALKFVLAETGGAPNADAYVSKTLSGFSPGSPIRIVMAMWSSNADSNDSGNHLGIEANAVLAHRTTASPVAEWFDLTAECEANGAGEVEIRIGAFDMVFLIAAEVTIYCDNIRVYRNCP